jgi:outer membrane protein TolC
MTVVVFLAAGPLAHAVGRPGAPPNAPAADHVAQGEPAPEPAPEAAPDVDEAPPAGGEPDAVLTVEDQMDVDLGSLPERDESTNLRLRFDTLELERLYEALREEQRRDVQRLTLDACLAIALTQNQDIIISGFGPQKSAMDVLAAKGEYDPVANTNVSYLEAEQSTSAETITFGGLASIEFFRTTSQSSVGGKLPWGTQYSLTLDLSKEETTYNDFIEEWSGSVSLSLTQPLLRGRGYDANLARIRTARKALAQAESQVRLQVMNSLAEVVRAYWDLAGAIEQVSVREKSLANAERLLDINEKRFEIGTVAPLEVVQAKAGVATRQSDLIGARAQVRDAMDRLKNVLGVLPGDPLYGVHIAPVERPSLREVEVDFEESLAVALENRPDVETARLAIESARIEKKRASNDLLPQFDVTGSVTSGGRGHYMTDVFDGARELTDNSYTVGFRGSVPIPNRSARAAHRRAGLDVREMEQRLVKTQQDVELSVRSALRAVRTNRILVESNRQARALQESTLEAENRRLDLGYSTSFELLRVEEDLANAQTQEVQSIINYEKSIVDLRVAEGVLLSRLGIAYEPPGAPKPVSFVRSVLPIAPE